MADDRKIGHTFKHVDRMLHSKSRSANKELGLWYHEDTGDLFKRNGTQM